MGAVDIAIQFIAKKHDGQYRKGLNIPYSTHLFGVARILKSAGYGESVVIAGLLHDILEDSDATEQEVAELFGEEILEIVKAVSEPDKSVEWFARKNEMICKIAIFTEEQLAVALAEKIQNLMAMQYVIEKLGEQAWKIFSTNKNDQGWFYESFLTECKGRWPNAKLLPLMEEKFEKVFKPVKE